MLMTVFLISVRTAGFASIQDETVLSATALVLDTKAMSALMVSHTHYRHTIICTSKNGRQGHLSRGGGGWEGIHPCCSRGGASRDEWIWGGWIQGVHLCGVHPGRGEYGGAAAGGGAFWMHPLPVNRMTHAGENITFPTLIYAMRSVLKI